MDLKTRGRSNLEQTIDNRVVRQGQTITECFQRHHRCCRIA